MDINNYFATQGCRMIERLPKSKVRYIAQCGHEHTARLDVFKHGSSRKCKQCTIQSQRENETDYHKQEGESLVLISKLLENALDVQRTNEGCLADFLIRPLGMVDDAWAQVQLKTTMKAVHNVYNFSLHKKYPHCIILCHCVSENRFWIFRDYEVPEKGLGIRSSGKYTQNEVIMSLLGDRLNSMYETIQHVKRQDALVPTSQTQRTEYEYRLKREKFFSDIQFEYPLYEYRRYDFIVNGKKYQEKVATWKDNRYVFKSNYAQGDNDYYFIHIPDSDYFYCIPESLLIDHQNTSGCITINTSKHKEWYAPYRHTYTRRDFSF